MTDITCMKKKWSAWVPSRKGIPSLLMKLPVKLLDGKKRQLVMPGHDRVEAPIIEKKSAQILSVTGNMANVMDMETYETFDMEIPEELKAEVKEGKEVLYWTIMGAKVMKQVKA